MQGNRGCGQDAKVLEGVWEFGTPEISVGNGLRAVPPRSAVPRNGTEAVPYNLEFPDTLRYLGNSAVKILFLDMVGVAAA